MQETMGDPGGDGASSPVKLQPHEMASSSKAHSKAHSKAYQWYRGGPRTGTAGCG